MAKKSATVAVPTPATYEDAIHTLAFGEFAVEHQTLPISTQRRIAEYGFGKMLQDAASGTVKRVTTLAQVFQATGEEHEAALAAYEKKYGSKASRDEYDGYVNAHPAADTPEALAKAVATAQQAERFAEMLAGTLGTRTAGAPRVIGIDKYRLEAAKKLLAAKIKAKGMTLPKVDSDDYKAMLAKIQARFADEIEEAAQANFAADQALTKKPTAGDDWLD